MATTRLLTAEDLEAMGQAPRTVRAGDTLDGGAVIPGFRLPVADIFA